MQAVILCGGLATRLGSLTQKQPKSMINIAGKPFLEHQLDGLRDGGVSNIVLCVGHLGEQIEEHFGDGRKFGVDIVYSSEGDNLLGTAGALKKAEALLDSEFFIMYGDSYLFLDYCALMSYFNEHSKLGLMTVYRNRDLYDKSNVVIEDSLVKVYSKTEKSKDMVYIDYGASILRKNALELIPSNKQYPLEDFSQSLIKRGELLAYEIHHRFYEIGSPQGLKEFEEYIVDKRRAR